MTSSKVLFCLCVSFIAGIFFQSIIKIPQMFLWGFLFLGILIIFISFWLARTRSSTAWTNLASRLTSKRNFGVWGFCVLFLVLGIVRLQISEFNAENDKLKKLNDLPEKISLSGQIVDNPDLRDSYQRLKIKIEERGSIVLVTTDRHNSYQYLDKVAITGKLKTPEIFKDFNYKNYLLKDGIYSVMDFPEIKPVSREHDYNFFSFSYEKILILKEKLSKSINSNFSPPQNSVLDGIVFGNDKSMPKDLKESFNITGLSHLTAVSGGNIVILIFILTPLLLFLGFWRNQAFYASIVFVWFYVALVGFPASGIRAAIMGSIFLLAQILGRQNAISRAIILAAALMLLQNPLLLFYDVGFQLSFLASMGIIHLNPLIGGSFGFNGDFAKKSKLKDFIYKKIKYLLDIVSVTVSAQVFVLPVIIYNFETVSLVAPLTNLLILPIVPFLMSFGFLAALFGIFSHFLGWVFSLPCYFLLFYFLRILDAFNQPWATKNFENVSWVWLAAYYFILSISIFYLNKIRKPKFLGY